MEIDEMAGVFDGAEVLGYLRHSGFYLRRHVNGYLIPAHAYTHIAAEGQGNGTGTRIGQKPSSVTRRSHKCLDADLIQSHNAVTHDFTYT